MGKELVELLREARHLIADGYGKQLYGDPYVSAALERIDNALAQPAQAVPSDVERDAARYRWLRDAASEKWAPWADERDNGDALPHEIDAAIDAAMLAAAPEGK